MELFLLFGHGSKLILLGCFSDNYQNVHDGRYLTQIEIVGFKFCLLDSGDVKTITYIDRMMCLKHL